MKTKILILAIVSLLFNPLYGQNILITDDNGYYADSSAMLDIKSTTKGLLIPRLTTLQIKNLVDPAIGLFVFNADSASFYYFVIQFGMK